MINNGWIGTGVHTFEIYVEGKHVDTVYGEEWQAADVYALWQDASSQVKEEIDTPYEVLLQDDSYWKNGHIAPLRIEMTLEEVDRRQRIWDAANPDFDNGVA